VAAEPQVFALVSVAAELSQEVAVLAVELSPEAVVLVAAEPQVFALVSVAAEPEVAAVAESGAVSVAAEPQVVSVVEPVLVSEPGVAFVAVVSVADAAGPQASADIAVAFHVLVPVFVVVVEVDSPGRPRFFAFPSIGYYASPSSSVAVVGKESVHNSTGDRTNYGCCSTLSSLGLHHNKNLERCYNNPSPGYNTVSDTNHPAMDATTSHSRKTGLPLSLEQRKHSAHQGLLSHSVVLQTRWAEANQY
jgi:hypothetical protein